MARNYLNFITFNTRSLVEVSRRIELNKILINHKIDICFLQETRFRKNSKIHFENFSVIRDFSNQGTAILISKGIKYLTINVPNLKFPNTFIEIKVSVTGQVKKYLLGSVYIPTNFSRSDLKTGLDSIQDYSISYAGVFIGEDFNSRSVHWGDSFDNLNGLSFNDWLNTSGSNFKKFCDVSPSFPVGPSYLDHFLVSASLIDANNENVQISSLPTFSDHYPLKLIFKFSEFELILSPQKYLKSFEKTNWEEFRNDVHCNIVSLNLPFDRNLHNNEIDQNITRFNDCISREVVRHSEEIEIRNKRFILPEHIKKLFKIKYNWQRDLKKIFHRNGNRSSSEYRLLSAQIQLLKTIVKERVEIYQVEEFNKRLEGPRAFKEIFKFTGNTKSKFFNKLIVNEHTYTEDSDKVEQFKQHFSNVYKFVAPERPDTLEVPNTVNSYLNNCANTVCEFSVTTNALLPNDHLHLTRVSEVNEIINSLNAKRSSGLDNLSNFLVKKLPPSAMDFLVILFNNCLNNGYFPKAWKMAKIYPLVKKPNYFQINNSRPISMLSNIGKLLERVIKNKLEGSRILDLIPKYQFGFKPGHSSVDALAYLHNEVTCNLRKKKCTIAVSLDIEKAFDRAYHLGIIFKLIKLRCDPFIIKMLNNYFKDRQFLVEINATRSNPGDIFCGVPQGAILAPLLYSVLVYDFPHIFNDSKSMLYADDSLIYAHDSDPQLALRKVQIHLLLIDDFYKDWGININTLKSKAICFRNASGKGPRNVLRQSKTLNLSLRGSDIPFGDQLKYLGVTLNKLFKFNQHGRIAKNKTRRIKGMFTKLLINRHLGQRSKLLIYKVCIRSAMLYGFPIWFSISPTVMAELEILERSCLRLCVNANYESFVKRYPNSFIYGKAGILPLSSYTLSLLENFVNRLGNHENSLMRDVFNSQSEISWSNSAYMSPVGIIHENIRVLQSLSEYQLPEFYSHSILGSNRG